MYQSSYPERDNHWTSGNLLLENNSGFSSVDKETALLPEKESYRP
jgi:hypothetical protein